MSRLIFSQLHSRYSVIFPKNKKYLFINFLRKIPNFKSGEKKRKIVSKSWLKIALTASVIRVPIHDKLCGMQLILTFPTDYWHIGCVFTTMLILQLHYQGPGVLCPLIIGRSTVVYSGCPPGSKMKVPDFSLAFP